MNAEEQELGSARNGGEVVAATPIGALPPGQRAIMRSFAKHGLTSVYVPSDLMDLRVCSAMRAKGLLVQYADEDVSGYELSVAGAASLTEGAR